MAPLEPWQKVYINLGRNKSVADLDVHLRNLTCVDCHGGDNTQPNDKEAAHKNFNPDPSALDAQGKNVCANSGCHEDVVGSYKNSMHQNIWGERKWVALRMGYDSFDQCPQSTQQAFNGECTSCHATCGDCHVSIPNSAGKGFISSHKFMERPDQTNNCMACHGSRLAHDFLGNYDYYPVRYKDVHSNYFTCIDCHGKEEMHSAATAGTDRYHNEQLPSCEQSGCHNPDSLKTKNIYHSMHYDKLSCFVCHSQRYNNCTGCHVKGEWKTDPEYQNRNPEEDFRIGYNPNQTESGMFRFEFITVRHIPVVPNTYANWGAESANLTDYDKYPTWKYTSPHNIRRFTARTDTTGGKQCWESCHTKSGFGNPENKKYFLFRGYIQTNWPDEVNANESTVVDDHLPDGWN